MYLSHGHSYLALNKLYYFLLKKDTNKPNTGDEPIRVIISIYMEMSQGNSLYSYLKQTKTSVFREQEGKTRPDGGRYQWEGET
jgi:hypothetical protein